MVYYNAMPKKRQLTSALALLVLAFSGRYAWAQGTQSATPPPGASGAQRSGGSAPGATQGPARSAALATARTETRRVFAKAAGRLEPARRITHASGTAGTVEAVHVRIGERVAEGQLLVTIMRDAPGEAYKPVLVRARLSGTVSSVGAVRTAEIKAGESLVVIVDDSSYGLSLALSDKDAKAASNMAGERISASSLAGASLTGTLEYVSLEPDYATGLYTVFVRIPVQQGARLGELVFAELPTASARGVFVPRTAIVRCFGRDYVWSLAEAGTLPLKHVEPGAVYGDDYLILSGLMPGQRYLPVPTGNEREGSTPASSDTARERP